MITLGNDTILRQYIRNEKKIPIGLMIATLSANGSLLIGWSMCNPSDKFDKKHAELIAMNRMTSEKAQAKRKIGYNIPVSTYMNFCLRVIKYFQADL